MDENTLTLVGQIYDAVAEPDKWNVFLDNLARSMNSHAARIRMLDKSGLQAYNLIAGTGHDNSFDKQYQDYFTKLDPWNQVLAKSPTGQTLSSEACLPDNELVRTEIYNDFWKKYDVIYGLGGNIVKTDKVIARIGVHRARSQGAYSEKNIQLLESLMPHLMRAFKLGKHFETLQAQVTDLYQALYLSPSPLLLIDEYEHVALVNQRAELLLGDNSGLYIINSRLKVTTNNQEAELKRLLQQAVAAGAGKGVGSGGAMRVTAKTGENRYNLLVTPYPHQSVGSLGHTTRICAAVFIHDSQQSGTLPANILKSLYGLTRSEIRLAEGIIEGLTPAEAAAKFGVSVNTTRTQLRSLFAKTDTQRQAELVRLLMGLTN